MIFALIFVIFCHPWISTLCIKKNGWLLVNELGVLIWQEAEAAEAARQEMVRQQRNAKRALLKEADKKEEDEEDGGMTGMTSPQMHCRPVFAWHIFILVVRIESIRFWWRQRIGFKRGIREMATLLALGLIGSELRKHNRAVDEERRWGSKRKGRGVVFEKCRSFSLPPKLLIFILHSFCSLACCFSIDSWLLS